MRRWLAASLLLVAACTAGPNEDSETNLRVGSFGALSEHQMPLSDGRIVTCVVFQAGYKGGVSCDWERASGS